MNQNHVLEGDFDADMIRRWAYDENALLIEQDEDLVLPQWDFAELLFELAADPTCPKASYIIGIWGSFTWQCTMRQDPADLARTRRALEAASRYREDANVGWWIDFQSKLLRYVDGVGPITAEQAIAMAHDLLGGTRTEYTITLREETSTSFVVELSIPEGSYRERLSIDRSSGKFRYEPRSPRY